MTRKSLSSNKKARGRNGRAPLCQAAVVKILRNVVIAAYVAISAILLVEIALSWHALSATISEYLSTGAAGYVTAIIVFTAPVSSLVIAILVSSDASGLVMLPFVAHTIVAFPATTAPAILLLIYRMRSSVRHASD